MAPFAPDAASGDAATLDLAFDPRVRRVALCAGASRWLASLLWAFGALSLIVPALVVAVSPRPSPRYAVVVGIPGLSRPAVPPPPVEPVAYQSFTPDQARAWNARIAFAAGPVPPARPFRFPAVPDDLARATDCLAAAVYYEAGDDPPGQAAVAQVVLNRVRHPAFPKTVCGVVFQGAERTTGCQFTFTCDGSLINYTPTPDQWTRARAVATAALKGSVYKPVGWATHYHTDWVVPYWQPTLDKLVAVHTQLFYRWQGWWGTGPAFDRKLQRGEPVVAALARLSEAHRPFGTGPDGLPLAPADVDAALMATMLKDGRPAAAEAQPGEFLLMLPPVLAPVEWPAIAQRLCAERERCTVMAWRDRARTPASLPLEPAQVAAMSFSYLRDRAAGTERTLWNCREAPRADPGQCMKDQAVGGGAASQPAPVSPPAGADLAGVRRKGTMPVPTPAPSPSTPEKAGVQPGRPSGVVSTPAVVP